MIIQLCSAYNITDSPLNIWFGFNLKFSLTTTRYLQE